MEKAQITFAEFMTEKMYTESFLFKISEIKSLKKGIKETRKSLDRGYQIDHAGKKYDWNDILRSNPNGEGMVRAYETKEEWIAAEQEWIRYAEEEISMEETEIRGYWDEYMEYAESEDLDMKKEMKAFAEKAKKDGFLVKMFTNGINFNRVKELDGIVDDITISYRDSSSLRYIQSEWKSY